MIVLTHFGNGKRIAVNVDLIEKVEETPDTVITLVNGTRYLVQESLDRIIDEMVSVKARVLRLSNCAPGLGDGQRLRLLRGDGEPGDDPQEPSQPGGELR
jgi:flagellar protein FlbD